MNFFKRLQNAVTNTNPWDKYINDFLSGADLDSSPINPTGNHALKLNVLFGCLRVLGETFATVPIFEFKKIDDKNREKTDDTGFYDILHCCPNNEMSAYNFKEMSQYQMNLGGNFVAKRQYSRYGEVVGLYPIEWQNVGFEREEKFPHRIVYVINTGMGEEQRLFRDEVFHVPGPSLNGIIGMSPIEYACSSIKLGLTYEQMGLKLFKNGTFPTGVFEHPGELSDPAYLRLREEINKKWTGRDGFGKPILTEDGMKFKPLNISLADAQLIESKRFTTEDICRIYRVPPHLVQDLSRSTNNNIEHQSLEFVMYTMLPHYKRWEEAINTQLLTRQQRQQGYYFEFNVASLLRGDQKSMAEAFAVGRQWGWLSVNDIRRMLNMNPLPGDAGDIYLQPLNMIEAGQEIGEENTVNKKILEAVHKIFDEKGGV